MRPPDACEGVSEDDEWMCGTCAETFPSRRALPLHRLMYTFFAKMCGTSAFRRCVQRANFAGQRFAPYGAKKRGAAAKFRVLRDGASHKPTRRIGCKREARTCRAVGPATDQAQLLMCTAAACRVVFLCFPNVALFALVAVPFTERGSSESCVKSSRAMTALTVRDG